MNFGNFSFRTKLVGLLAALLAIVSAFLLFYFPNRMDRQAREALRHRAEGIAVLLANGLGPALEFDSVSSMESLLETLESDPDVVYGAVRTDDGKIVARYGNVPETLPSSESVDVATAEEHLPVFAAVNAQGTARGQLVLGYSLKSLDEHKAANLWAGALVSMFIFAVSLGASFVIGTVLVRPIRKTADVALLIAQGDLAAAEAELGGKAEVDRLVQNFDPEGRGGDEVRRLSGAFSKMLGALRTTSSTLHESAELLTMSVDNLNSSAAAQNETITRQASALQQTQVTAQEIKETSVLAAQKAEAVLKVAQRADEITRSGESAIEESLGGMSSIQSQVQEIARRITELRERTRQIGGITQTVKDLADQSNMLALNAAIEAVRSGEHGKGFGVVAREIRTLADQSIQATNRVREILDDIGNAIGVAVQITQTGAERMEAGLVQMKTSGDNLRELSNIVKDNSMAVRQIATAVNQQNVGITQIFSAVSDLSRMMTDTMKSLESTGKAAGLLKNVSEKVSTVAKSYRL